MIFKINLNKSINLLFSQVAYSGKSFLIAFVLARYFDKVTFGVYSFAIIGLNNYLALLTNLVYEPLAILKNEVKSGYSNVITYLFRKQWQLNLILFPLLFSFLFFKINGLTIRRIVLILVFFILSQMHEFFKRIQLGQLETKVALAYDLAATVFQLSFLFLIFLLKKMDLDNVFMALSLGCIPTILFGLVKHPEVFAPHAAIKDLFAHNYYKYVKPNLMFFVVGFSSNQFNNFAIFLFLGSSNLANCEAVRLIVIPLHITILAMGSILIPYFSKNLSMYGREEAIKKFKHVFSFSLVLFCIFALFVLIMGPISLTLFYGIKYQSQFILLVIYTFVYVFDGLNTILISFLKSLGLINEGLRWRFVVAIVNLILVFPLLHLFKEAGGLFSMMISSAVMVILYFNILRTKKLA